jgi:hypothetical protein
MQQANTGESREIAEDHNGFVLVVKVGTKVGIAALIDFFKRPI